MTGFVVFRAPNRDHAVRFWTGDVVSYGGPQLSRCRDKAKVFATAREAYDAAGRYEHRDFFRLKVGRA